MALVVLRFGSLNPVSSVQGSSSLEFCQQDAEHHRHVSLSSQTDCAPSVRCTGPMASGYAKRNPCDSKMDVVQTLNDPLTYSFHMDYIPIHPVREGRFSRAFLKRSGMRRLRVVPRKHASGRPGSPSGPTMRLCHVMAGRGWDEGGEIRRMASHWLASQPGSTVPAPKIAASGAPQGDTPSAFARGGRRTDYRCALRRTAPLIVEGRGNGQSSGRFRPRERRRLPVAHAV
jgi:hypothetical protein